MRDRIRVNGVLYEEVGRVSGRRNRRLNESKWRPITSEVRSNNFPREDFPDLPDGNPPRLYERRTSTDKRDSSGLYAILSGCETRWGEGYAIDVWYWPSYGLQADLRGAPFFKDDAEDAERMFDRLVGDLDRLRVDGSDGDVSKLESIANRYSLELTYWD